MSECIFCKIVAHQEPALIFFQDEFATAFATIRPMAPVHILIVPNRHIESINTISPADEPLLGHLLTVAQKLAKEKGIDQSGFRLIANTGYDGGQSVYHFHFHLLGGKHLPFRFD